MIAVEERVLLSIEDIKKQCNNPSCDIEYHINSDIIEFRKNKTDDYSPCIIPEMKELFGTGEPREYYVFSKPTVEGYTHASLDIDFFYCEEWFEKEKLFEKEEFEEMFSL